MNKIALYSTKLYLYKVKAIALLLMLINNYFLNSQTINLLHTMRTMLVACFTGLLLIALLLRLFHHRNSIFCHLLYCLATNYRRVPIIARQNSNRHNLIKMTSQVSSSRGIAFPRKQTLTETARNSGSKQRTTFQQGSDSVA